MPSGGAVAGVQQQQFAPPAATANPTYGNPHSNLSRPAGASTGSDTSPSHAGRYPSASSYSSVQYPSAYLPNNHASTSTSGSDGVLKARNVAASTISSNSNQGYMLPNSNDGSSAFSATGLMGSREKRSDSSRLSNPTISNNKSIALLLLPPLMLLFLYEMSSSLPLLVLFCCGLIVYSFDLANTGTASGAADSARAAASNYRGYYTMCAIWMSWLVLSMVVSYDAIFLGEEGSSGRAVESSNIDYDQEGNTMDSANSSSSQTSSTFHPFQLALLLSKLSLSIFLLFQMATWTTIQFHWLPTQMPMVAIFLERILYSTLPPVSAAMVSYGIMVTSGNFGYTASWGVDGLAMLAPMLFSFHLTFGILLVGSASSMMNFATSGSDRGDDKQHDRRHSCAIHPREGRRLSHLLVFLPPLIHLISFRQRIMNSYASWDDLFDFLLIATVPYTLHYLLASNGSILDEKWRRSLPWLLKVGTSPAEGGERTLRGASVPMAISLAGSMAFQHRYLLPLCARASYIMNGHDGVISPMLATTFLTCGTISAFATVWFFGRKNSNGDEYLMGDYHEDFFQLILAASSVFYALSFGPKLTFLPVPMLFAESLALWILTKQLRYAVLTAFVFLTVGTIAVAYRLTFLNENVEVFPGGKTMILKKFAELAMYASIYLFVLVGLIIRSPGGYGTQFMRKYDVAGICLIGYGLILIVMEFALLREPMPLYSRDNYEVGRVAVYSPGIAYFTGCLTLLITWHVKAQHLIKEGSVVVSTSIVIGKMLAVLIESSLDEIDAYNSLGMLYLRWAVASLLLITICVPYSLLEPVHVKISAYHSRKKLREPSAKPSSSIMPKNASWTVVLYCAVLLPLVIVSSVRLVLEPLVGLLTGQNSTSGGYSTSPKLSEIIGYSASLWGISVLSMINHFLPDGGAEVWRRVSALTFIMGLFVSFAAPAFPGASPSPSWDNGYVFQSVSSLDTENDVATGGWGLVSAFLAILLAMSGPLELRELKEASGRRDTRHLLRLMIFGMMFGCGLSWFITMQSMSKDIFIPIFVTTFACMAMSTLGTVAAVMGYFLDVAEFYEAEQIANVWTFVGFPVFFVISSMSLSAHAHPFGIGGWASTYLSVCGLLAGAFCVMVRLRDEKNSTTRGYSNMSCVVSWLCATIVIYGRYGVAGVGVVGTTSVAGIQASVLGTILCSPILLLLEGEGGSASSGRKKYQASTTKSKKKGLVLSTLTRSNWFAPLLAGIVGTFIASSIYAIFLRGCGISKFSLLFGTGDVIKSQEDVFSHVYGSARRTTGVGALDDVATMAKKSMVHTRTMVAAAKLSGSGIWTSSQLLGPLMHFLGLIATLPSLQLIVNHSWHGLAPTGGKIIFFLPLNILAIFIGRGIPSLVAAATIGFVGGIMQLTTAQ